MPKPTIEELEAWIHKVGYVTALAQLAHIVDCGFQGQQVKVPWPVPALTPEEEQTAKDAQSVAVMAGM